VVLLKAEDDHVGHLLVKTEPKQEPVESSASYTSSLADLDGITDLLPIQTGRVLSTSVFRILNICCGFVPLTNRSGSADPYLSLTDPDTDLDGITDLLPIQTGPLLYQCSGSINIWYGSGSADPYLLLTDPDPRIRISH
jgi:hypothetical protein